MLERATCLTKRLKNAAIVRIMRHAHRVVNKFTAEPETFLWAGTLVIDYSRDRVLLLLDPITLMYTSPTTFLLPFLWVLTTRRSIPYRTSAWENGPNLRVLRLTKLSRNWYGEE